MSSTLSPSCLPLSSALTPRQTTYYNLQHLLFMLQCSIFQIFEVLKPRQKTFYIQHTTFPFHVKVLRCETFHLKALDISIRQPTTTFAFHLIVFFHLQIFEVFCINISSDCLVGSAVQAVPT